jgi:hypothetical protein
MLNWGASSISMKSSEWNLKPETTEPNQWPYVMSRTEKLGDGTMLFLIDQGGFSQEDFVSLLDLVSISR